MNVISGERESITNSLENITVLENHMKQILQCAKEEQYKQKKLKYLHSTNAEINLWRLKVLLVHQKNINGKHKYKAYSVQLNEDPGVCTWKFSDLCKNACTFPCFTLTSIKALCKYTL